MKSLRLSLFVTVPQGSRRKYEWFYDHVNEILKKVGTFMCSLYLFLVIAFIVLPVNFTLIIYGPGIHIHMDTLDFWTSTTNPHKCGDPHWYPSRDIHARTFYNGYPWNKYNHEWISMFLWLSVFNCVCFCWYPFGYPSISVHMYAGTCHGSSIQSTVISKSASFKF